MDLKRYDFDQIIDRRNTQSRKWEFMRDFSPLADDFKNQGGTGPGSVVADDQMVAIPDEAADSLLRRHDLVDCLRHISLLCRNGQTIRRPRPGRLLCRIASETKRFRALQGRPRFAT